MDVPALPSRLLAVANAGLLKRYRRGTLLMQEGEPGGSLYFVREGLLRAFTSREDGNEYTLGFLGPGETLGEVSLDGGPRSASVIVEQAATCSFVARSVLEHCIASEPALAFDLMGLVARRLRSLTDKVRDLALTDAYSRLVVLLHAGSEPLPDGRRRMAYALNQTQMAQQIGCSRPMVNKLLRDLVQGGWLVQEDPRPGQPPGRMWVILRPLPARW